MPSNATKCLMDLGSTFKIVRPNEVGHLWVVISRGDSEGSVVTVNLTSRRHGCDETCVVQVGEHPFIHHETVVAYVYAKLVPRDMQEQILANPSQAVPHAPVSAALLRRIQKGALDSRHVPPVLKKAVKASL